MDSGWIKLHRKITDNWVWNSGETFSKNAAWIDILLSVNFKENTFLFDGELITCEAGEIITSETKLSDKWKWSRTKVRKFLELLEKDRMISVQKKDKRYTKISVCNFSTYQSIEESKKQVKNKTKTSEKQVRNIIEEGKKERRKEVKYAFDDFWDLYDKKRDRKKCESKWLSISEKDKENIMEFIPIYKESEPDEQYRKYPYTFLNSEIWNDDWESYKKNDSSKIKAEYFL